MTSRTDRTLSRACALTFVAILAAACAWDAAHVGPVALAPYAVIAAVFLGAWRCIEWGEYA